MKKSLIIIICLSSLINAAEQTNINRTIRKWMPKEYAKGNTPQINGFTHWLEKYDIPVKDKKIISFGCGTGEIEEKLAQKAAAVLGTDACENMIAYDKERYHNVPNLCFQHCFTEDFQSNELHDLAIGANFFHWVEDKPEALKRMGQSIKPGGQLFINIETTDNAESCGVIAFQKMKENIPFAGSTGSTRPTSEELHRMLQAAHFEIIQSNVESYDWTMTEQEWKQCLLPLALSTPAAQGIINTASGNWLVNAASTAASYCISMTEKEQQQHNNPLLPGSSEELIVKVENNDFCKRLCNRYIDLCLAQMKKNDDGTYTWRYETTIILAQKQQLP